MSTYRARSAPSTPLLVAVVAAALIVAAAAIALVVTSHHNTNAGSSGGGGGGTSGSSSTEPAQAEAISSSSPTSGQQGVSPAGPITLSLTQPLAAGSPMPKITPSVGGSWSLTSSTTLTFEPTESLVPFRTYTVSVPGGEYGLRGASGDHLASSVHIKFTVAAGSFLRLQQLLASLDYLPVSFVPSSAAAVPASQEAISQLGTFKWRWAGLPATLTSQFEQGNDDVFTQGAVMNFENLNGLATDGIAGPDVWSDLLHAVAIHQMDPNPWDWVYVQKTPEPETLFAWSNGKMVFQTLANTGATGFATPDGSWPVYLHYASTTMQGTNPDGTHYDDTGVLWVSYFFKGDALHAFLRGGYGTPQSLGCVEMPTASAQTVWPLTPIGTVVTVQ
jgi:hypothetical protein